MPTIGEQEWTEEELAIAKALYCHDTLNPRYDFDLDQNGWSKLMYLDRARAAIKALYRFRKIRAMKAQQNPGLQALI